MTILETRPLEANTLDVLPSSRELSMVPGYEEKSSLESAKAALWDVIGDWFGRKPLFIDLVLEEAVKRSGIRLAAKEYVDAAYWRLVCNKEILKDSSSLISLPR